MITVAAINSSTGFVCSPWAVRRRHTRALVAFGQHAGRLGQVCLRCTAQGEHIPLGAGCPRWCGGTTPAFPIPPVFPGGLCERKNQSLPLKLEAVDGFRLQRGRIAQAQGRLCCPFPVAHLGTGQTAGAHIPVIQSIFVPERRMSLPRTIGMNRVSPALEKSFLAVWRDVCR